MKIIADTHVHIYPSHDLKLSLDHAVSNLKGICDDASYSFLCLTERYDCHYFRAMREGEISVEGYTFAPGPEPEVVDVLQDGAPVLHILAGSQIISRGRVEVLGLAMEADIPDGLPVHEIMDRIARANGVPVLSWAPGKWFFKRGRIVQDQIMRGSSAHILLGDTTLRPTIWPEPRLMKFGKQRGAQVIAGSDPLPFAGEEQVVGSYASILEGEFDEAEPAASLRHLLFDHMGEICNEGRRGGPFSVLSRLKKNAAAKR